jgi:hypothetical protein
MVDSGKGPMAKGHRWIWSGSAWRCSLCARFSRTWSTRKSDCSGAADRPLMLTTRLVRQAGVGEIGRTLVTVCIFWGASSGLNTVHQRHRPPASRPVGLAALEATDLGRTGQKILVWSAADLLHSLGVVLGPRVGPGLGLPGADYGCLARLSALETALRDNGPVLAQKV